MLIRMCVVLLLLFCALPLHAQSLKEQEHPFIAWTKSDMADAKKRIDTHDWAKREFEQMMASKTGQVWARLFAYSAMGDLKAADEEKKYLLSFINAPIDPRAWSDNYLNVLRYDVLYDLLSKDERKAIEDTFRKHIDWQLTQDKRQYTKTSWLPNMQWPRPFSTYLMAVALQDEKLIKECFNDRCGWKYYFDDYVADGHFYMEEFGKQYSMNGEMLLWAQAMDRLGMPELGFDYKGKNGATLRKYLEAYLLIAYPFVYLGDEPGNPRTRPMIPHVAMGDAKGGAGFSGFLGRGFINQQNLVAGYTPKDGQGGGERSGGRFTYNNMNGRDHKDRIIEKLHTPMWFEMLHRKYPDAGFDWLLTQMRTPDQDKYYPTLFFGLDPIEPAKTKAPKAPSGIYPERGFAILRADESENYWTSPAPALSFRAATPYVHQVSDSFSLLGLYAFNRPLYINRQVSSNYAGVDPGWSNSLRSHSGVMVDGAEPTNTWNHTHRKDFRPDVKFAAFRTDEMFKDVLAERMFVLTNEYVLDIYALNSAYPRNYQWQVQALGTAFPDNVADWAATRHLVGSTYDVTNERSFVAGEKPWSVTVLQRGAGAEPDTASLGERWFKDRVGVRMTMLGEEGTIAYTAVGPAYATTKDRINYGATEPGNVVLAASRNKRDTIFIALHEPFKNGPRNVTATVLERTPTKARIRVAATGFEDTITVGWLTPESSFSFDRTAFRVKAAPRPAKFLADWKDDTLRIPVNGSRTARLWLTNLGDEVPDASVDVIAPPGIKAEPAIFKLPNIRAGEEAFIDITFTAEANAPQSLELVRFISPPVINIAPLRTTVGVVSETSQVWPRDFAKIIHAPRYSTKIYYINNTASEFLLDPLGLRRFDGGQYPRVLMEETVTRNNEQRVELVAQKTGGFLDFNPRPRKEADGSTFLADTGTHPHGRSSPFEYRFTQDWIWIKYKPGAGKDLVFDWTSNYTRNAGKAAQQFPERTRFFNANGEAIDKPIDETAIRAMWRRPAGFAHGELTLYPDGARLIMPRNEQPRIAQKGDDAMAFTYAAEEEIPELLKKWLNLPAPVAVPPWRQGDMGR